MNADDGNTYLAPLNRHRDVEADAGGRRDGFEGSAEWRWTKRTCAGLFRELGRCYDEVWFPTVIKEWSALYYQCNHEADYWRYLDEWTVGDPRVRDAVWLEILTQRSAYDRQREDRQQHLRDTGNAESMHVDDEQAQKVEEMYGALNEADDLINLRRVDVSQKTGGEPQLKYAERKAAEIEKAEIAMADPDDSRDWVEMRRRMRGSFAGLNLARLEANPRMLQLIMMQLCKYWTQLPPIDETVDPLLERNIMREINNFRTKLFGPIDETEPPRRPLSPERPLRSEPRASSRRRSRPPSRNESRSPPRDESRLSPVAESRSPRRSESRPPPRAGSRPPPRAESRPPPRAGSRPPPRAESRAQPKVQSRPSSRNETCSQSRPRPNIKLPKTTKLAEARARMAASRAQK